jgi:hypothetical protein
VDANNGDDDRLDSNPNPNTLSGREPFYHTEATRVASTHLLLLAGESLGGGSE